MATKPIPAGSVNFPVNMPKTIRQEVGRLAFIEGKALGAMIREMLSLRVEEARRAGRFSRQVGRAATIALGIVALAAASFSPTSSLIARRVRCNRGVRTVATSFANRVIRTRAAA